MSILQMFLAALFSSQSISFSSAQDLISPEALSPINQTGNVTNKTDSIPANGESLTTDISNEVPSLPPESPIDETEMAPGASLPNPPLVSKGGAPSGEIPIVEEDGPNDPSGKDADADSSEPEPVAAAACDQETKVKVVKCFLGFLDDWAFNFMAMQESLASLNCSVHSQMNECLQGNEGCTLKDYVDASTTVTDLLIFNHDSGSFLYSFLALEFACQTEGQEIIRENLACLQTFHEGQLMLIEVEDLQEKINSKNGKSESAETEARWKRSGGNFISPALKNSVRRREASGEDLCSLLETRSNFIKDAVNEQCNSESAAYLACKTVANPFLRVNETTFAPCKDRICPKPEPAVIVADTVAPAGSQNGEKNGGMDVHQLRAQGLLYTYLSATFVLISSSTLLA